MAIELSYGTYQFPLAPVVTISRRPAQQFPRSQAYVVTWRIEGELYSPGAQSLAGNIALRNALLEALAEQRDLIWKDGATVVKGMIAANAIGGLSIVTDFPSDETAYATHVPFRVEISGVYKTEHVDQSVGAGPLQEPFEAIELIWGEYTVTETIEGNEAALQVSGSFRAPDQVTLRVAIEELAISLGGHLLQKTLSFVFNSDGVFQHQAQFQLVIIDTDSSPDVFEVNETIEVRSQTPLVIVRQLIGGVAPILQSAPLEPTYVIQEGTAVGRSGYPNELVYVVKRVQLPEVEPRSIVRHSPELRPGGHTGYRLSWRFVMVSTDPITAPILPIAATPHGS